MGPRKAKVYLLHSLGRKRTSQYPEFVRWSLEKIVSPVAASQLDTISSENILKLNLTPTIPQSSETIPEDCGDDRIYDIEVRDPQTSMV